MRKSTSNPLSINAYMSYQVIDNIPIWGEILTNAVEQMKVCARFAQRVALMADHHVGMAQPIGGVTASKDKVSISGVGPDVSCGNKAIKLDIKADEIKPHIARIMDDVWRRVSFGVGRKNKVTVDHPLFDDQAWNIPLLQPLKDMAREQLGTVGAGNHHVIITHDQNGFVWVANHFGSRGLGYKIARHFMEQLGTKDDMNAEPAIIDVNTDLGREYLACMHLAGRFAYAGRDWVCDEVNRIIGGKIIDEVHNHHNFAWHEEHDGEKLWVVRKGCTPAAPGQRGFVGASMGEASVIIEGVDSAESCLSLRSAPHGAGRVMSRTQAAGKSKWIKGVKTRVSEGRVSQQMLDEWVKTKAGVELRGGGLDESPHCYKRLTDVLAAHAEGLKVTHTLTPIGVAMAGSDEIDPYKD